MRHPHYARTLAGCGRVSSAGQSLEVRWTEQAKCLGGTSFAPSTMTEQGLEYTFSGGYAKNPKTQALTLHNDKTNTIADICRTLRIGRTTLYRYLAEGRTDAWQLPE
jgi:hypothetical protein